jgi:hypothetical protein
MSPNVTSGNVSSNHLDISLVPPSESKLRRVDNDNDQHRGRESMDDDEEFLRTNRDSKWGARDAVASWAQVRSFFLTFFYTNEYLQLAYVYYGSHAAHATSHRRQPQLERLNSRVSQRERPQRQHRGWLRGATTMTKWDGDMGRRKRPTTATWITTTTTMTEGRWRCRKRAQTRCLGH